MINHYIMKMNTVKNIFACQKQNKINLFTVKVSPWLSKTIQDICHHLFWQYRSWAVNEHINGICFGQNWKLEWLNGELDPFLLLTRIYVKNEENPICYIASHYSILCSQCLQVSFHFLFNTGQLQGVSIKCWKKPLKTNSVFQHKTLAPKIRQHTDGN